MPTQIYGKNPVIEALNAGRKVHKLMVSDTIKDAFLVPFQNAGVSINRMPKRAMDALVTENHQGVIAMVDDYASVSLEATLKKPGQKRYIMLDNIEDPHNLGAVLRNADAFGVCAVIIPKHRSVSVTPTVVKVSAGAVEHVDVVTVTNLTNTIETLKKHNVWVVGTAAEAEQDLRAIRTDTDLCIVFGSEKKGLGSRVKSACDYLVRIPMQGAINSLNVSVSSGIVLYSIQHESR